MIYDWEREGDFPPEPPAATRLAEVREVYFTADDFDHVIVLDAREPEVAEEYRRMGIVWDGAGIFQVDLDAYLADRVRTRAADPGPGFPPFRDHGEVVDLGDDPDDEDSS